MESSFLHFSSLIGNGPPNVRITLENSLPHGTISRHGFTRISHSSSWTQRNLSLSNTSGWVNFHSDTAMITPTVLKMKNLAGSKYVLALSASQKNRTLLFLLGYSYASSPGSLDVVELPQVGAPRRVLHRDELGLVDVRDLDGDGIAEIVTRPCLSEVFGNGLQTYDPLHVYALAKEAGDAAALSLPLSKDYNIKHYYGWAGPSCSEKFAVVLHPPRGGKPFITTTQKAQELTEGSK